MKAYQRFLKRVSWTAIFIGALTGFYFGISWLTTTPAEEAAVSAWCLDNGGRRVTIDGSTGCFALTQIPIDVGFLGSERAECVAEPAYIWHRFNMGGEHRCYSFVRIVQED